MTTLWAASSSPAAVAAGKRVRTETELGSGYESAHAGGHKLSVEEAIQLIVGRFDADSGGSPDATEPASTRRS